MWSDQQQFIICFCIVMVIITIYHLIEKKTRSTIQNPGPTTTTLPTNPQPSPVSDYRHVINILPPNRNNGLDRNVLKSIPYYLYDKSAPKDSQMECAVCLSVFKDRDSYRELPVCLHKFHVECIDMWFYSHSTCPLCRANVKEMIQPATQVLGGPSGTS